MQVLQCHYHLIVRMYILRCDKKITQNSFNIFLTTSQNCKENGFDTIYIENGTVIVLIALTSVYMTLQIKAFN